MVKPLEEGKFEDVDYAMDGTREAHAKISIQMLIIERTCYFMKYGFGQPVVKENTIRSQP
jgi:hypothetical protein